MADDAPKQLHAPWRMEYIRSLEKDPAATDPLAKRFDGCFLCAAAHVDRAVSELGEQRPAAMRRRLVVWQDELAVCLINRYPYTSGHLMIAPRRHVAELEDLTDAEAMAMHAAPPAPSACCATS